MPTTSGSSSPIRPTSQPNSAISSALLTIRCHSGFTAPAPRLRLVTASAGAYSTTPISAPTPAPTAPMAAPSTAPPAPPSAAPHTKESSRRPDRLRRRRSGLPMQRSITAPRADPTHPPESPAARETPQDVDGYTSGSAGAGVDRHGKQTRDAVV